MWVEKNIQTNSFQTRLVSFVSAVSFVRWSDWTTIAVFDNIDCCQTIFIFIHKLVGSPTVLTAGCTVGTVQ